MDFGSHLVVFRCGSGAQVVARVLAVLYPHGLEVLLRKYTLIYFYLRLFTKSRCVVSVELAPRRLDRCKAQ